MADVSTALIQLTLQEQGNNENTWGQILNDTIQRVENAIAKATTIITTGGPTTLSDDQARNAMLLITGGISSNVTINVPARNKVWMIANNTSGAFTVTVKTASGTGVVIPQGKAGMAYCDGVNVSGDFALTASDTIKTLLAASDAAHAQTALGISTFVQTLLDDADDAAFFATLGFSASGVTVAQGTPGEARAALEIDTVALSTGDMKIRYGTGALAGFVRLNGNSIGNAASSATERANADCEDLFLYLWQTDANLSVSGGRGLTAAADWAANKRLSLPDGKGRGLFGLDDMGGPSANRITSATATPNGTTLGASGGEQTHTLTTPEIPAHTHNGTTAANKNGNVSGPGTSGFWFGSDTTQVTSSTGGGGAHNNMPPFLLVTFYIKL